MNHDLSYLRTEYAREKMIEEYRNEEKAAVDTAEITAKEEKVEREKE
jgi:hypothetical protein